MSTDPWTTEDPQPGDFDALLDGATAEPHAGDRDAVLRVLVSVEGEDARRLERMAQARGKSPHDVVAELLRDADRAA